MSETFTTLNMQDNDYQPYIDEMIRSTKLSFKINQTEPYTEKARELMKELLCNQLDESSSILGPLQIDNGKNFKLGKHVFINHSLTVMAIGGVHIEDHVMIAPEVTLLTANHEFDNHYVLLVKKIHIKENAWIGAKATILPGITIGKNSVVAGASVVTKDVPDNVVVGGNPARILKHLTVN